MQAVFGQIGIENEIPVPPTPSAFGAMASFLVPKLTVGLSGGLSQERSSVSLEQSKKRRERHAIRPPVQHNWSLPGSYTETKLPQIFQHELLQNFSINMFCKVNVIFYVFSCELMLSAFSFNGNAGCSWTVLQLPFKKPRFSLY